MRNLLRFLLFLVMAAALAGCGGGKTPTAETAASQEEETIAIVNPSTGDIKPLTAEQQLVKEVIRKNGFPLKGVKPTIIVVNKLSRKLTVYQDITPRKTYPVVLGADPYNDKLYQGDRCTPEGVYRVVSKYPHPKWSHFILLDYPNDQNWLKFARAKIGGRLPEEVDIGGQIGIHGTEDDLKNLNGQNWTRGCVSLMNKHVEEVYSQINDNTLVIIKKK